MTKDPFSSDPCPELRQTQLNDLVDACRDLEARESPIERTTLKSLYGFTDSTLDALLDEARLALRRQEP